MSGYAQLMKKTGGMTKKGKKELEAIQSALHNEISISDDEEAETVGAALTRKEVN
jgi:hypothetical protein